MMTFAYGQGQYEQADTKAQGEIILSDTRLYLRKDGEELASTFVPLDKIRRVHLTGECLEIYVRLSVSFQYWAYVRGESKHLKELVKDLAERIGLKKLFLRNQWIVEER